MKTRVRSRKPAAGLAGIALFASGLSLMSTVASRADSGLPSGVHEGVCIPKDGAGSFNIIINNDDQMSRTKYTDSYDNIYRCITPPAAQAAGLTYSSPMKSFLHAAGFTTTDVSDKSILAQDDQWKGYTNGADGTPLTNSYGAPLNSMIAAYDRDGSVTTQIDGNPSKYGQDLPIPGYWDTQVGTASSGNWWIPNNGPTGTGGVVAGSYLWNHRVAAGTLGQQDDGTPFEEIQKGNPALKRDWNTIHWNTIQFNFNPSNTPAFTFIDYLGFRDLNNLPPIDVTQRDINANVTLKLSTMYEGYPGTSFPARPESDFAAGKLKTVQRTHENDPDVIPADDVSEPSTPGVSTPSPQPSSPQPSSPATGGDGGGTTVPPAGDCFVDVHAGDQFADDICWAKSQGITTGWPDGTYRPVTPINRDALIAYIYRLAGSPAFTPSGQTFSDVAPSNQFYKEIEWAASTGITTGWPDGTFRPTTPVARDAMAAFLYRRAGSPAFVALGVPSFTDVGAGNMFYQQIEWMKSTGVSTGWVDGTYRPLDATNRDAMAAFLHRYSNIGK